MTYYTQVTCMVYFTHFNALKLLTGRESREFRPRSVLVVSSVHVSHHTQSKFLAESPLQEFCRLSVFNSYGSAREFHLT